MFANIHHKGIKRFSLEGSISDEALIPRLKIKYIKILETDMRGSGYVPRLDIDPDFTIGYNHIKEYFELTKSYQEEYGNNTILLMQVGSFFLMGLLSPYRLNF